MANTRQSTKRARQAGKRNLRNQSIRSTARSTLTAALNAVKGKDIEKAKTAYMNAVKTLSKAASKGALPKNRAARKLSRLARFAKKTLPTLISNK